MNVLRYIYTKIKSLFISKSPSVFYTKDFFKDKKFIIGDYTYGKPKVFFENEESNLIIGKFCSIAGGVTIFLGGNHRLDWISTYPFNMLEEEFPEAKMITGHPTTKGDVKIGNDVWIGQNAVVMSGITIGNGAVIAANSVVTKNIKDYEVWGGNPAKFIKKRFSDSEIEKLLQIQWWDWELDKIKSKVNYLCSDKI